MADNPIINGVSTVINGLAQQTSSTSGGPPGSGGTANSVQSPGSNTPVQQRSGTSSNAPGYTSTNPNTPSGQDSANNEPPINQSDAAGRRVRLRPKEAAKDRVYGAASTGGPLQVLRKTNGMIWPYQPTITWSQDVDYKPMELTHANQDIYAYHKTQSLKLTIEGDWSVQNQQEGQYAMACIHFLKTVSKMNFGENDQYKGTPPPVLLFDAYGTYMFNRLPVIVTQYTINLPNDVDYVPVSLDTPNKDLSFGDLKNNYLKSRNQDYMFWLPAAFKISVSLIVQNSPSKLRSFNLEEFRSGKLVTGGGWI